MESLIKIKNPNASPLMTMFGFFDFGKGAQIRRCLNFRPMCSNPYIFYKGFELMRLFFKAINLGYNACTISIPLPSGSLMLKYRYPQGKF